jgi:aspartate aminotransferase-like enzyme
VPPIPRLLAPGPVAVPPAVLEVLARPAVHHRTDEFRSAMLRAREELAAVMLVPGDDVMLVAGSGTSAFEAALLASVPAGARVVAAHAGKFGERWARMARRYGFDVAEVSAAWGRALDAEAVVDAVRRHPDVAALTITHSETSTGVLHDLEALASGVREVAPDVVLLVDAVTSLAAAELRPREWDLDGVIAGSQKGVMLPPGLGFAWLSERAWARAPEARARVASFSLDLHAERPRQRRGETGATPPVPLVLALPVALELLRTVGLEELWREKRRLNDAVLAAGAALGYRPLADRPSPAVAALLVPDGVTAPDVTRAAAARGVRIAGGQDELKSTLIRPSLLGYTDAFDALTLAGLLEVTLLDLGRPVALGAGVSAAQRALYG